jgi:ribosomal protein L16/L10AE
MSSYLKMRLRRIRRLRALAALARMEGISRRGKKTRFHKQDRCRYDRCRYALKPLEPAEIPIRQIEAGRWAIERYLRRRGKLWVLP